MIRVILVLHDLIKVYADWQYPTLRVEEMRVIVEEAHHQKLKAAAHATTPERIKNALMAGVDSIEHGHQANRENLEMMKAKGTFLVPTVGVIDAIFERTKNDPMTPKRRERRETFLQGIQQEVQQAMSLGVKIASGFDAGAPARQGRNADELVALTRRGMPPLEAIRAATVNAAELLNWQDRVGAIEDCCRGRSAHRRRRASAGEVRDERRGGRERYSDALRPILSESPPARKSHSWT